VGRSLNCDWAVRVARPEPLAPEAGRAAGACVVTGQCLRGLRRECREPDRRFWCHGARGGLELEQGAHGTVAGRCVAARGVGSSSRGWAHVHVLMRFPGVREPNWRCWRRGACGRRAGERDALDTGHVE
jgi:hypothetical protein